MLRTVSFEAQAVETYSTILQSLEVLFQVSSPGRLQAYGFRTVPKRCAEAGLRQDCRRRKSAARPLSLSKVRDVGLEGRKDFGSCVLRQPLVLFTGHTSQRNVE